MLQNYIKIAWRNLVKNRTFTVINIIGLSFSVAFCLLLFFYIRYEQSYDAFHVKKDHLFRMEMSSTHPSVKAPAAKSLFSFLTKNDDVENQLVFPLVVAANMQNTFPEVKSILRFKDYGKQLVKVNNEVHKEQHAIYADSNFFSNLSFHLIKGSSGEVLGSTKNVVLSESTAKKYFGTDGSRDAMGKIIELVTDTTQLYLVSGIAQDAPANSSIQYDLIFPLLSDPGYMENIKEGFNHQTHLYVIELCMGLFGLSAINAINRTKEIGIRKVLGASVKNIVATLSSGFIVMVAIAVIIATPLAWWIMDKWLEDFAYHINLSWWMFSIIGILALIIALATVSFQAIKAAIVNPIKSLRTE